MIQVRNAVKSVSSHYNKQTMLRHLSIRNYAIAEQLDIEFASGMTVLTGETGAGKSIILGAMSLILGDRADREVVRSGSDRADISAEFDVSRLSGARLWLSENTLEADEPELCLIRRSVSADGRSRAWINNSQVTLQALSTLGDLLMDIHSQHEHHSLLKKATHQWLLDDYAGLRTQAEELRVISERWKHSRKALDDLQQAAQDQSAQLELARYQLAELEELDLAEAELENLDEELDQLTHAESRLGNLQRLLLLCREDDETTIIQMLQHAQQLLEQSGQTEALRSITEMLGTALIQVEEAASEINRLIDRIEINPERLLEVNQRLGDIHQLARKHKVRPDELFDLQSRLQEQLHDEVQTTDEIRRLQAEIDDLHATWLTRATGISKQRRDAAVRLGKAVNEQLQALSMRDARLTVALQETVADRPQPSGLEQAEFLISTNAGQAPKPLTRIASGGELSRISLAIQVITALTSDTPTLVFDEVDVGIGGGVARTVGKLLRQLGTRSQVFCVTHQALVASQADHHLLVSKHSDRNKTQSEITALTDEQRLLEIARMLGGDAEGSGQPSAESLAHARELTVGG